MKIKSIIAMAMAAVAVFASCSKDDNDSSTVPATNETKSFFIQIKQAEKLSRAEGADMSSATVSFKDGYLVFAAGDEITRVIGIVETISDVFNEVSVSNLKTGAEIPMIPAKTTNVYLYGNLGSSISDISSKATVGGSVAEIEKLVWTLADIQNAANDVAKVPVSGNGVVAPGAVTGDTERLESKFNVKPVASRLQIASISCSDANVTEFKLAGIYINSFLHSMNVSSGYSGVFIINNSIDKSKYPTTGYAAPYASMSDIISPAKDIVGAPATATQGYWAYNFFPTVMPHVVLHFSSITADGVTVTDKYVTVANYRTSSASLDKTEAGKVYKLNIDITDYKTQVDELPESGSSVMGYVEVDVIDWSGVEIFPEW